MEFMKSFEEAEKFDKLKTKMMRYILYKKRTENEVRQKFKEEDENLVEDAIEYFKEQNYINDLDYIERSISEFMNLKTMSIKEISYKFAQKGIKNTIINDYICKNKEKLLDYEIKSASKIWQKKLSQSIESYDIEKYLYQKGYMSDTINIVKSENET